MVEFWRSANTPQSAILSGITIVVVEDYPDTLFGIVQFLTRHGAKVFPCPDAFQGRQAVREVRLKVRTNRSQTTPAEAQGYGCGGGCPSK